MSYNGKIERRQGNELIVAADGGEIRIADGGCLQRVGIHFDDDFLGAGKVVIPAAGSAESGAPWVKRIVGAAPPTVAGVADYAGGGVACTLTADSQAQTAGLDWGDQRGIPVDKGGIADFWVEFDVLETSGAYAVFGLGGDYAANPNTIARSLTIKSAAGSIFVGADDAVTDSEVDTGIDVDAGDTAWFRIDFRNPADIKFFMNGDILAPATTHNFTVTGANAVMQPFVNVYKASGTGVGTLVIDRVAISCGRS